MKAVQRSSSVKDIQQQISDSDNRCICEICTCGRHRCPQQHIAFRGETTNHHDYKPYNISLQRHQRSAYKVNQKHYDPDLLKSTYRVNYQSKPCPAAAIHTKYAYQPNNLKFYDETEYNKSYVANKIEVEGPVHRPQYRPNTARFQGTTTYGEQFKAKRREQDGEKKRLAYQTNTLPFYANTTYGDYYQPFQVQVHPPASHAKYTPNTARFQGKSSYQQQFNPHPVQRDRRCLIEEMPARPRECSPGRSHVHYRANQNRWD